MNIKMNNTSVRWAFNFSRWNPSFADMLLASSCIQHEEKERLARFVFKKDMKSSLVGRLMMRKFVYNASGKKYNEIKFIRDDKGKPLLFEEEHYPKLNFNVSHQGHYVVFAAECGDTMLGVDIMKLEYLGGRSLTEFFRLMNRHFSPLEWQTIKNSGTEKNQIAMFCRHWCLKESYVKAIGVGITVNLQDISFKINTKNLSNDYIINDTELYLSGEKLDWEFQEMLLDSEHCVAVALSSRNGSGLVFKHLTFEELMESSVPLLPSDEQYCNNYFKRLEKH